MASKNGVVFEDFFPSMVEKLGAEGFMDELCNGFRLLVDEDKGVITFESLKRNSATVLGLQDMSDDELKCMLREADLDGDGSLNQTEFCVLMFRLSPDLMKGSRRWLEEVVMNEF
ncbi:calcium-binding protein PBP1-like [Actinidia eriantha]|uniref:calcium-binding protein PBP1-like n=1 Tax=Actinidia eriantha TaxID=165200 RepID=UPI0025871EED|nr:calcium-binding protein PBP1-like [Actinidia eriantha]